MKENIKRYFTVMAYQAVAAAVIFLVLMAANRFVPTQIEKIGAVWEKSTDVQKMGKLFARIGKELIPF